MAKKENNIRKHPGESGPRPDKASFKREEAIERQTTYDKLSVEEKLSKLPANGAKKQREKLSALLPANKDNK